MLKKIQPRMSYVKKESSGRTITVADLEKYAVSVYDGLDYPDEHEPHVIAFSVAADDDQRFVMVWSTKRLMNLQHNSSLFQADATYKNTWHGFPILV